MKAAVIIFVLSLFSFSLTAQSDTLVARKPVTTYVYTKSGGVLKGLLYGRAGNNLLIFPGSKRQWTKESSLTAVAINYENITIIKTKKPNGFIKGFLLGGAIGFAPAIAGEGGAYVALVAFPLGIITGSIIGATSKKKYAINGNYNAFVDFTDKFIATK